MNTIDIAGHKIGPQQPCFLIAEAGVNHNGDPELAKRLIDVAAESGVDAVKFQTFDPELLASPEAAKADYQQETTGEGGTQREMLRRLTLPSSAYGDLKRYAARHGLIFLSTPFDESSADFLTALDLPALKVSSGDLTNLPFLAHLAGKDKPLLVSTGMATLSEVSRAIETISTHGTAPFALLHCVSNYPTAPADCNLRAIETMFSAFDVPIGWSDHTEGFAVTLAAVALGAQLIEKHFTLDRDLPGPDHSASLEPHELKAMVAGVREVEAALGDGIKRPRPSEEPMILLGRKSLHWRCSLVAGDAVTVDSLIALRPSTGMPPERLEALIGQRIVKSVWEGQPVRHDDLESEHIR